MNADLESFSTFLRDRRGPAAAAYVCGDAGPLRAVTTEKTPATFFGPRGGSVEGASEVWETYARDAGHFAPGSTNRLDVLQLHASGDLAFWTGLQVAKVNVRGKPEPVEMELRVTEVFRREGGTWMLVHRHADMLAAPQDAKK